MATKLDSEFVAIARKDHQDALGAQQRTRLFFETLVNEVNRLEAYCAELEARLSTQDINEASQAASQKW